MTPARLMAALAAALLLALPAQTPAQVAPRAHAATLDYRLQARALAPGVYVVEGDNDDFTVANGCNIINTGFIATGAGVVVINTGPSRRYGEQLRALIARTTPEPVVQVLHLNLHPDYFLGNQAFADVPRRATAATLAGMQREAASYETNLYRLCGDWMKGTESLLPSGDLDAAVAAGVLRVGTRELRLVALQGHTTSDLVLVDSASGVVFAGGLVFHQRVPTTPHAELPAWRESLQRLRALPGLATATVVPSHGPVHRGSAGLDDTEAYLAWLHGLFTQAAQEGVEMNELLRLPMPPRFAGWAARAPEYVRNVAHLYPRYERAALPAGTPLRR